MVLNTRDGAKAPPPLSRAGIIVAIAELDETISSEFRKILTEGDGFNLSEANRQRLAGLTGRSPEYVTAMVRVLEELYRFLNESEEAASPDFHIARLNEFFGSVPSITEYVETVAQISEAILPLVSVTANPRIGIARKRQRLREGFIPNAVGFSTFVDLRPNFKRDFTSATDILELVRQIQLVIHTDSTRPEMDQIVLQLDDDGYRALREAVDLIESKLQVLRTKSFGIEVK